MKKIKSFLVFLISCLYIHIVLSSCSPPKKTELFFQRKRGEAPALGYLPRDKYGTIDWVQAYQQGIITPKDSLDPKQRPNTPLDLDVYFDSKGDMPGVMYPHLAHTQWLDCTNCHPHIFKMQRGSNPITMLKIVQGEFCGRCHGKVAFPLSNCLRCHSVPGKKPPQLENIPTIQEMITND